MAWHKNFTPRLLGSGGSTAGGSTMQWPKGYAPVEAAEFYAPLEARFGIPASTFDDFLLYRSTRKSVALVSRSVEPTQAPPPSAMGLVFLHDRMAVPKLTTEAVIAFGHGATRNFIELDADQVDLYLDRQDVAPRAEQLASCVGQGHVIVRREGLSIGLGFLRLSDELAPSIKSYVPKAWRLVDGVPSADIRAD